MDAFTKSLRVREKEVRDSLDEADKQLSELQSLVQQLHRELDMVSGLLDIHDKEGREQSLPSEPTVAIDTSEIPLDLDATHPTGSSANQFESSVADILAATGDPMHVSKIENELRERKIPIPGKGTVANLITRIRRANGRFVRVASGTYGLSEWNLKPMPSKKKARKRATRGGAVNG